MTVPGRTLPGKGGGRDGGYKNNWSFDHGEESEGDLSVWETSCFPKIITRFINEQ
uniref:Uncharacterized protein n=1 Tax=Chelonoidis abingdonii TaxID=106734 RepID=A0A8C0J5W1_CHEAB